MELRRKHYFPENNAVVVTGLLPTGEYGAYREDEDEGHIRGYGHNRFSAIADLVEWIKAHKHVEVEDEEIVEDVVLREAA